jgi:hypothetical protein
MAMTSAGADFRVGAVIGRSFHVLRQHFFKFMALAILMWLPLLLVSMGKPVPGQALTSDQKTLLPLAGLAWLVFFAICQPAVIFGAFQTMRDRDFQIGEAFGRSLGRILPVLGAGILIGISIAIGTLLLVIPGIILWTMFYVAIPACVVERLGPIKCIGRSAELTSGHRWKIFGLGFLVVLVGIVLAVPLKIVGAFTGVLGGQITNALFQSAFMAFQLTVYAVAYHDLRAAKEGIDIEELASVFD